MASDDYLVIGKYIKGRIVDPQDKLILDRLQSVGLIHMGTHIEIIDDETKLITLQPTAKATVLGRGYYNAMRPTLIEKLLHYFNSGKS